MPSLSHWRDIARKAAQALKRQLAQTENGLSQLLNPSRAPRAIPVPLPQRRAPRFPGDKRFYTQATSPSRSLNKTRSVASIVKTEFGRTLTRPRLTSGTLRSHGYGRNFSTTPLNHGQVAREVYQSISQGIRAGVLNTPFFPPTTGHVSGKVMHGIAGHETTNTILTIPLCPQIVVAKTGQLDRAFVNEVDEARCATPQFLAKLRRDLNKLMRYGNFPYTMTEGNTAIQIAFHGKDQNQVERFLGDVGISTGTLTEQSGLLHATRDETVSWRNVFAPAAQSCSVVSLDRFVEAIDQCRYGSSTVVL